MDLKSLKDDLTAKWETTEPQKLAYAKMGIDSLIAGMTELAKLGILVEVNEVIPPKAAVAMKAAPTPKVAPAPVT